MKKFLIIFISACLIVGMPSCKRALKKALNEISNSAELDGSKDISDINTLNEVKETLLSKCDNKAMAVYEVYLHEDEECTGKGQTYTVSLVNSDKTQGYAQTFFFNGEVGELRDSRLLSNVTPLDLNALDMNLIVKGIEDAKSQIPEGYTFKTVRRIDIEDGVSQITMALTKDGEETVTNAGQTSEVYYDAKFDIDNATGKATDKN
ncbi:MAG: hypothetical protein K2K81_02115 [Muribaculaceae bacterium]|nr:hypothetical protein [Muribaculaceae bacterium]